MPIYGYRCSNCGHELEVLQKISDAPLKTCPECQGELRKILYPAGVIFKGSGYYTTDYKAGGSSSGKGSSNGSGSEKSGGESKSGESKAATEPKSESTSSKSDSSKEGS